MIKHLLLCTLLLGIFNCAQSKNTFLQDGIARPKKNSQGYSPDISFCIVDLKYKTPHLKICEFGQGSVSGFHGYHRLYGTGSMWKNLWKFLAQFQAPIFYINPQDSFDTSVITRALPTLNAYGGIMYRDNLHLKSSPHFTRALQTKQSPILVAPKHYYVFRNCNLPTSRYYNAILLDNATRPFVLNKLLTHLLFMNDSAISHYRPKCKILPTRYSATMAQEIIKDIPSPEYVIKPMNAYHGKGIVFVTQENLEQALKTILCPGTKSTIMSSATYEYWHDNPKPYFIIESRETSTLTRIEDKYYEPTMRVAFGLSYNQGIIDISFFGAYWKLPKKSLDEEGSLAEKYQSRIKAGTSCSAKVDSKTFDEVKKILKTLLPKVYLKMVATRNTPELLNNILTEINAGKNSSEHVSTY